jgi:hypothetical protein
VTTATTPRATKIRAGLYQVTTDVTTYMIEDRWDAETPYGHAHPWTLTDESAFHDPWRGDYATKREALAQIALIEANA